MKNHPDSGDPRQGTDSSEFFRVLAKVEPPEEFWEGFWPSVRAAIRIAEVRVPPPRPSRASAIFVGASAGVMAAAAIFVAAFLATPTLRAPRPKATPAERAMESRPSDSPLGESPPPPVMEDLRSASARVYTFHVGEPADSTDVILIVDESLDI